MSSPHGDDRVVALVPAAGQGVRLGESMPKAFVPVGGSPMLTLAVEGLMASGAVDRIVIMVPAELIAEAQVLLATLTAAGPGGEIPADAVTRGISPDHREVPPDHREHRRVPVSVVAGGTERTDSVRAGLAAAPEATHVLVHDAARALTPPQLVARVVGELRAGQRAVVPGVPVTDTIKSIDDHGDVAGTPDRARLRAIQTPQGFDAGLLRDAYAHDVPVTDDAGLVELLGATVRVIPGDPLAFKITTPLDLHLARTLLAKSGVGEAVPR